MESQDQDYGQGLRRELATALEAFTPKAPNARDLAKSIGLMSRTFSFEHHRRIIMDETVKPTEHARVIYLLKRVCKKIHRIAPEIARVREQTIIELRARYEKKLATMEEMRRKESGELIEWPDTAW